MSLDFCPILDVDFLGRRVSAWLVVCLLGRLVLSLSLLRLIVDLIDNAAGVTLDNKDTDYTR